MAVLKKGLKLSFPYGSLRRFSRNKRKKPWYENPFLGPLTIAVIGSIIVLVGQLAATILPIYYGPSQLCDFSINAEPANLNVLIINNSSEDVEINVSAWNIYPVVKEYKHQISIEVLNQLPDGITIIYSKNSQYIPFKNFRIRININGTECQSGEYPLIVQGSGADGLKRNCSFVLNIIKKTYGGVAIEKAKLIQTEIIRVFTKSNQTLATFYHRTNEYKQESLAPSCPPGSKEAICYSLNSCVDCDGECWSPGLYVSASGQSAKCSDGKWTIDSEPV